MKSKDLNIEELQYLALLNTYLDIPKDWLNSNNFSEFIKRNSFEIKKFYEEFCELNFKGEIGYSKGELNLTPKLEDVMRLQISEDKDLNNFKYKLYDHTICLSHDIDYLAPTIQMKLKRLLHDKKLKSYKCENYLESLKRLFEVDSTYTNDGKAITIFVAATVKSVNPLNRINQWLLDPSYDLDDNLFADLFALANTYGVDFGIHGSFYSLSNNTLNKEILRLHNRTKRHISVGRQHWLRLPLSALSTIGDSGIKIDSTIAWNNSVGFRGGFARPYPIVLNNKKIIWEVPLVIMDGALKGPLNLSDEESVKISEKILENVKIRGGCVSLDWHERSASLEYSWIDIYEKILKISLNKGFKFKSFKNEFTNSNIFISE